MLSDKNYTNGLETQYGHDAAGCPIQSIQAKWKARQAASIDPMYVSFTEIEKCRRSQLTPSYALQCWLRNRSTVDFLFLWEKYQNPKFKQEEALALMQELEESNGTLTLKQWIERTNAIGITTLPGRYGGTYAARTLADDFEMWISPKYRYYAFQRNRNSFAKWIEDFEHTKDMEKQTGKNVD